MSELQQQYIIWGLLIFSIIIIFSLTVHQDTSTDTKQKDQCSELYRTVDDNSSRCFDKETILDNYYEEHMK